MDENDRIRERAHKIWIEEGQPEGRSDEHWQMARQLVAIETGGDDGTEPVSADAADDVVEDARLQENLGEFPTLTDQGEEQTAPKARSARSRLTELVTPGRKTKAS